MVNYALYEAVCSLINRRLSRLLDVAKIGIPNEYQFDAYRKVVLDEFGKQGFLPELATLLEEHGSARNGQAKTAGKEVPR